MNSALQHKYTRVSELLTREGYSDNDAEALRDILADLMHWAEWAELNFDAELSLATDNYACEREEN